jgi:hypothetical protein
LINENTGAALWMLKHEAVFVLIFHGIHEAGMLSLQAGP